MKNQVLTALTVNILSLNYGIGNGWIAPNLVRFQAEGSPIGIITPEQAAFIVSLSYVGSFGGTSGFGLLGDRLGRKWTLVCIAIPQIMAFILLLIGTNPSYIYASRLLFGVSGGGLFIVLPIFVSEISKESIRGALGTVMAFFWTTGIVLGYVLASWMEYYHAPYVPISLGVLFIAIFIWLPESPDFLSHSSKNDLAAIAYNFYGNHRTGVVDAAPPQAFSWSHFKDPGVRRGCWIAFILLVFADSCGILTITYYVTELLQWANIQMDIYLATVGLGIIQIVGCCISAVSMDRFGRRILFMVSSLFTGIAMFLVGFHFYLMDFPEHKSLVEKLHWLPILSLAMAILSAALAIGAAPFYLIAELLPMSIRARFTTISGCVVLFVAFMVSHSFHYLVDNIGVFGTYWMYASICFIETVFVYVCLPETKNLTIDEIQKKLSGKYAK